MKWLDGPMRPMPPKGSVRIWTKRLCGEQVSLVWLFFSLLALALAAFPLIVDGRYTNGNWDVPAIALAAVGFGGICVGTRKILSIDLEKRSFEWRLNVLFPVRRCVGRLDHNCRFVVEESVGPIPGLDIFQRDPFQTLSFQSDSRKLKVLLVRTGTGLGLNWLRSLPDEFQIPVEIGTGSTRQIPEFAGYFPVATIKPPREVREETPDRLRIEPPPRRNTGITPLVGAVALLLISGADLLHFNAFAGVLEFLRVQSVRHPVLKIPAVVAAGAMIGLSLADWIGRRTDTLIEFEDGNLSVLAESPTGARKVIAKRHVSEIGTFMFDSGSAVSAPRLLMNARPGFRSRSILRGADEATIRWVANWLTDKSAGVPPATLIKPVRDFSRYRGAMLCAAVVASFYAALVVLQVVLNADAQATSGQMSSGGGEDDRSN